MMVVGCGFSVEDLASERIRVVTTCLEADATAEVATEGVGQSCDEVRHTFLCMLLNYLVKFICILLSVTATAIYISTEKYCCIIPHPLTYPPPTLDPCGRYPCTDSSRKQSRRLVAYNAFFLRAYTAHIFAPSATATMLVVCTCHA